MTTQTQPKTDEQLRTIAQKLVDAVTQPPAPPKPKARAVRKASNN